MSVDLPQTYNELLDLALAAHYALKCLFKLQQIILPVHSLCKTTDLEAAVELVT